MKRVGTQLDRVGRVAQIGDIVTESLRENIQDCELARIHNRRRPFSEDAETEKPTADLNNLLKVLAVEPVYRDLRKPAEALREVRNRSFHQDQDSASLQQYRTALESAITICERFGDMKALEELAIVENALPARDALELEAKLVRTVDNAADLRRLMRKQGQELESAKEREALLEDEKASLADRVRSLENAAAAPDQIKDAEITRQVAQAAHAASQALAGTLNALSLIFAKRGLTRCSCCRPDAPLGDRAEVVLGSAPSNPA